MPINPTRAALAINQGYSAICAMCEFFHEAQDKGATGCGQVCGGPMAGGTFDRYRGPIVDFSKACFICGISATHAVRAANSVRVLGCCSKHVDTVKQFKASDVGHINIVIKSPTNTEATDDVPVPSTRVNLRLG